MKRTLPLLFLLLTGIAHGQPAASVLSSGKWYKLSVKADAVYKLDYSFLQKLGINPDIINPKNIRVYAGQHGMLPQSNTAERISDPQELAIQVIGQDDGRFDRSDYILFYGEGPDYYQLLPSKGIYEYQNHLYSDLNYYFLNIGTGSGKRITTAASLSGSYPVITEYDDVNYYETDQSNILHSGRDWFGEVFDTQVEYTIRFDVADVVPASTIKIVSAVMGRSFASSSFQLSVNGISIGTLDVPPLVNSDYSPKGVQVTDTLVVAANDVNAPQQSHQDLRIRFNKAATPPSVGYLDFILLQATRTLRLTGDQITFQSLKSLEQPITQFQIADLQAGAAIWDVTNPWSARIRPLSASGSFVAPTDSLRKFVALSNKSYLTPTPVGEIPNQNIRGVSSVDLLIITAPEFLSSALKLSSYRQSQGLAVSVFTTTQVYNEFSGGKQDVTAIRDAVRFLFVNGAGIRNLLLFGKGSYDYKDHLSYNKNFVPIYQSRNSLSPLDTYSSDDYYGFLEPQEGNWGESPPENHTLDIGVGRIPVKKTDEAAGIVEKIITYESNNMGDWRKEILFVADDGDFNIHMSQADSLAESLEKNHPEFNTKKIFLDSYKQEQSSIGPISKEATMALTNSVRHGLVIVNYTGHGNEQQWMQERILDQVKLEDWTSAPMFPLLVTATCEFGRNDDPGLISTAELSMLMKTGGSIGLVTTARPVNSSTNFKLNKAFYDALFTLNLGKFRDLGSVFRDTKNNSMSGIANRNFSLLGDPSIKLALPGPSVNVSGITNLGSGSDTLKGLSHVRVNGWVYQQGIPDTGFNGTIMGTLYDKPQQSVTIGDENPPYNFRARENIFYNGQGKIQSGQFQMDFIMPVSIDPVVGKGKLSLYAFNGSGKQAAGSQTNVKVGSIESNSPADNLLPQVQVYIGDSTFLDGGIASSNTHLLAILSDENGINTSTLDSERQMIAILDDSITYPIASYYRSDIDNFRRGKVSFPLNGLSPGRHTLTIRASDTYGNIASSTIHFNVSDQSGIVVEELFNYPNPVSASTIFRFKHSRSGEDIEAELTIFNLTGQPVRSDTYLFTSSPYQVDLPSWDAATLSGIKLGAGLYLVRISVRSLLDGSKNEKFAKVIITN